MGRAHECGPACVEIIRRYVTDGVSVLAAGRSAQMSVSAATTRLLAHGFALRPAATTNALRQEGARPKVLELHAAGLFATQIARAVGVSRERVRQLIAAVGLRPNRRGHRCTETCRVVLAAAPPLHLGELARHSGRHRNMLAAAAKAHGLVTDRRWRVHECSPRCAQVRAVLASGGSITAAARAAGRSVATVSQRVRVDHPEFPWPPLGEKRAYASRAAGAHTCTPRCEILRVELAAGMTCTAAAKKAGFHSLSAYDRYRRLHPEFNWPKKGERRHLTYTATNA